MTVEKKSTQLRRIFESARTELMPFGALPVHAQMAERAGFSSFHLSGALLSFWNGLPDAGLMTRTEVVDAARRVVRAVDIPVYCDADTGYGGVQNVRHTVHEMIRAGVAGIHIEDQRDPKKAGGQAGIALVSDEEALGRLRVAVEARDELDPDFVITARTDGYGAEGGGLEEALRRGLLYRAETGVDVIFYEGMQSWEEARYLLENTPGPAYVIVSSKLAGPTPSISVLSQMGQSINIVPFAAPGVQELWSLLLNVRDAGELAPMDEYMQYLHSLRGSEQFAGLGEAFVKPSYEDVRALEERFLPADQQRDYVNTRHN
jgi:methylisocitrate lyase